MKKLTVVVALALLASGLALVAASKGTPYFATSTTGTHQDGTLYVHFKELNLPPAGIVHFSLSATVQAVYACVSTTGKQNTTNLTSVIGPKGGDYFLTADSSGRITYTFDAEYPDYPDSMNCASAPGAQIKLIWVGYNDVTFTDLTNNITPVLTGDCANLCRIVM